MTPEQERAKLRDYVIWSKNNKIARLVSNSLDREEQLVAENERLNKHEMTLIKQFNETMAIFQKNRIELESKVAEQDKEIAWQSNELRDMATELAAKDKEIQQVKASLIVATDELRWNAKSFDTIEGRRAIKALDTISKIIL